jgi:NADH-quinone oxidoreductase subunit G
MGDVAGDRALCVEERGDRAHIGIAPDHDLSHPWAANVIDLCPVGALISKDFANKARAWELDRTASVCPNCSQGCNVTLETRDGALVRMKPRSNSDVNQYYLCDEGRLNYQWVNRDDRLQSPVVAGKPASWDVALAAAGSALKGSAAHVVASASLSNEALWLLKQAVGTGTFRVAKGAEAPLPGVADLALRADRVPNATGAELLGFRRGDNPLAGAGKVVVIAGDDCAGLDLSALAGAQTVIVIGTVAPAGLPANAILLPIANFAEEEGTFTNLRGRVQRYLQARPTPGFARASWKALAGLAAAAGKAGAYASAEAVFAAMAQSEGAFSGMSYDTVGLRGQVAPGAKVNA